MDIKALVFRTSAFVICLVPILVYMYINMMLIYILTA